MCTPWAMANGLVFSGKPLETSGSTFFYNPMR